MEGYAYNAKGKVFQIAENTGLLKYKLFQQGIPVEVFSPTEIKKFATTKGNANKGKMHESFMKETKINLIETITPDKSEAINPVSDVVDSFYICKYLYTNIKYGI